MPYFTSSDEAAQYIGKVWELIGEDPDLGPKLGNANLVMKGVYSDPPLEVTIECRDGKVVSHIGDCAVEADATLTMAADTGHKFFLGALNLPLAMAKGQVKAEGKMTSVMKLLPFMKPAFTRYREYLKEQGREDLLA
ncbi:MAG: SCP2 sterol-binding domain-containing protein [Actinomycetota bacterium]